MKEERELAAPVAQKSGSTLLLDIPRTQREELSSKSSALCVEKKQDTLLFTELSAEHDEVYDSRFQAAKPFEKTVRVKRVHTGQRRSRVILRQATIPDQQELARLLSNAVTVASGLRVLRLHSYRLLRQ